MSMRPAIKVRLLYFELPDGWNCTRGIARAAGGAGRFRHVGEGRTVDGYIWSEGFGRIRFQEGRHNWNMESRRWRVERSEGT